MGWTYTSASQNTMLVDELDTSPAEPHIRSDFTPQVKFLAVSATNIVFDNCLHEVILILLIRQLGDIRQLFSLLQNVKIKDLTLFF